MCNLKLLLKKFYLFVSRSIFSHIKSKTFLTEAYTDIKQAVLTTDSSEAQLAFMMYL